MSKITVLGMGAMGSRMAISLLQAGHQLTIWNRSAEKTKEIVKAGAKACVTPKDAVQDAEFVISMVRDDQASQEVWLDPEKGALQSLSPNTIAIESSTLTVAWTKELGRKLKQKKITLLDAPVAGTRPQAEAAELIYFVGGDIDTFIQAQPILQAMGSTIHHVGSTGSGMAIKLGVNSLFAIQVSAMGELIGLMRYWGLDEAKALEIITSTPVCSPAAKIATEAMKDRQFAPLFPIDLVAKDISYALQAAQATSMELHLVKATHKVYTTAIARGYGADNITGIAQLYL